MQKSVLFCQLDSACSLTVWVGTPLLQQTGSLNMLAGVFVVHLHTHVCVADLRSFGVGAAAATARAVAAVHPLAMSACLRTGAAGPFAKLFSNSFSPEAELRPAGAHTLVSCAVTTQRGHVVGHTAAHTAATDLPAISALAEALVVDSA